MTSSGAIVTPATVGAAESRATAAAQLSGVASRLLRNEALKLGIVSSSSFVGVGLGAGLGAGSQCWSQTMAAYGNTASTIYNLGTSGAKVGHIADGSSASAGLEVISCEGAVRAHSLDALIVNINFNDGDAITSDEYRDRLTRALLGARKAGAMAILVPPLHYSSYYTSWGLGYASAAYAAGAKAGAVVLPIEATNALPDDSAIDPQWYQSDLIHPNAAGAARYGAAFAAWWPTQRMLTQSVAPRSGIGTQADPVVAAPFLDWRNANGRQLRTLFPRTDTGAGRDPALYPTVPHALLSRAPIWASECRVSGQTVIDASVEGAAAAALGASDSVEASADPVVLAGGGLSFDGSTGQFVRIAAPSGSRARVVLGSDDITVRVVTSANTVSADNGILIGRSYGGTANIAIYRKTDGSLVVVAGGTSTDIAVNTTAGPVAITVTAASGATSANVYANGALVGTATIGASREECLDWTIGARWTGTDMVSVAKYLKGQIHWASIGAAYTTAAEEAAWYQSMKAWLLPGHGVSLP